MAYVYNISFALFLFPFISGAPISIQILAWWFSSGNKLFPCIEYPDEQKEQYDTLSP